MRTEARRFGFVVVAAILLARSSAFAADRKADPPPKPKSLVDGAEIVRLKTSQRLVPRPKGTAIAGPLPRPVLFAQLLLGDGVADGSTTTGFYLLDILDPSQRPARFKSVFRGPGGNQDCRFLTPLFGGWGVVTGKLNPREGASALSRKTFWFHALSGRIGPTIAGGGYPEWLYKTELRLGYNESRLRAGTMVNDRGWFRYDLRTGMLWQCSGPLLGWHSRGVQLDGNTFLDYMEVRGKTYIIQVDLTKGQAALVAEVPGDGASGRITGVIKPVGPRARDGLAIVAGDGFDQFTLWWYPVGGAWRQVAKRVRILKTFGGRMPWLPTAYLGAGRFAVARTVPGSQREADPDEGQLFPQALTVTMLIDGNTGEVLKQTKPFLYDHNPPCQIPDDWWSDEFRPKADPQANAGPPRPLFQWNEKDQAVRYGAGKVFHADKDSRMQLSGDGRFLAICREHAQGATGATLRFDVLDGRSGRAVTASVTTKAKTLYLQRLSWLSLCSDTVTEKDIQTFAAPPWHPWLDPWGYGTR